LELCVRQARDHTKQIHGASDTDRPTRARHDPPVRGAQRAKKDSHFQMRGSSLLNRTVPKPFLLQCNRFAVFPGSFVRCFFLFFNGWIFLNVKRGWLAPLVSWRTFKMKTNFSLSPIFLKRYATLTLWRRPAVFVVKSLS